ncbi:MAG: hypothetical protein A3K59_07915 [Euryarchaeota archaeon RBG_19FT_COMBO_69_17]|nr:MAG: hypothetical protein A3K59_07915 [Euryarchaeota archaeon RBG_19FT_COMBO_69_17]
MTPDSSSDPVLHNSYEALRLQEVQLLLAAKRTSLSTFQTGIAVLVLPLSVVSFLVATSQFWDILSVLYLMAPLLAFCATLVGLGSYLIMRAVVGIQAFDAKIKKVSEADERLRGLVEVDRRKLIDSFRLRWGDGSP